MIDGLVDVAVNVNDPAPVMETLGFGFETPFTNVTVTGLPSSPAGDDVSCAVPLKPVATLLFASSAVIWMPNGTPEVCVPMLPPPAASTLKLFAGHEVVNCTLGAVPENAPLPRTSIANVVPMELRAAVPIQVTVTVSPGRRPWLELFATSVNPSASTRSGRTFHWRPLLATGVVNDEMFEMPVFTALWKKPLVMTCPDEELGEFVSVAV